MANENVQLHLREHTAEDGESYKIVKEVLDNLDPKAKNVVFFLEAAGMDEIFQTQLDKANNGELSYREVILNTYATYALGESRPYETYPMLKSMKGPTSGKQIADFVSLQYTILKHPGISYWAAEAIMKLSDMKGLNEFMFSRFDEFDRLQMELFRRGKKLIVITEDSTELVKDIAKAISSLGEETEARDLDTFVFEEVKQNVYNILLGIARDEVNSKSLRKKVSKLSGKTQIFSHFGTLHKYLPTALVDEKFAVTTQHARIMGFLIEIYNRIIEFSRERDISYLNIMRSEELIEELSKEILEKDTLSTYIGLFSLYKCSNLSYKQKIKYYREVEEAIQKLPEDERMDVIKTWLKEELVSKDELKAEIVSTE